MAQLLTHLDQAIAKALEDGIFTDEINPPTSPSSTLIAATWEGT
jgi:hypothetical protein